MTPKKRRAFSCWLMTSRSVHPLISKKLKELGAGETTCPHSFLVNRSSASERGGSMVRNLLLSTILVATLAQAQQTTRTRLAPMPEALPSPSASNLYVKGCVNGGKNPCTLLHVSTGARFDLLKGKTDFNRFRGNLVVVKANEFAPTRRNGLKSLPQLKVSD